LKDLRTELNERKQKHLYRARRISAGPQQPEMIIDGKKVINFCSNDYLGLANHPAVKQAFIKGIEQYGAGSGAAHLITGHSKAHHALEEELAAFTGYPRALLFSTGYMANLAIAQSLLEKTDIVLEDKLNHASLIDAGLISGARFKRYAHNDASDLEKKLHYFFKESDPLKKSALVMTDGVFSMDGTVANLPTLTKACQQHKTWLMVDDAHGFGVLGKQGKGTLEHFNLMPDDVPIYMATLGKAIGTAGAFVASSEDIIETLIQKARTYIYTTASPPALAEASRASLIIIQTQTNLHDKLNNNIQYFKQCCAQAEIPLTKSITAIQPIIVGDDKKTVELSAQLFASGLLVTAIRPPTVPKDASRLRITLSAAHTKNHIDQLVEALANIICTSFASPGEQV